jgi:hypothetical protein
LQVAKSLEELVKCILLTDRETIPDACLGVHHLKAIATVRASAHPAVRWMAERTEVVTSLDDEDRRSLDHRLMQPADRVDVLSEIRCEECPLPIVLSADSQEESRDRAQMMTVDADRTFTHSDGGHQ